jgi:CheY-like chemotaxis protein
MELGNTLDGADVVDLLREKNPSLDVVFVMGTRAPDKFQRMRAVSPQKILTKPVRSEELRVALGGIS